jgi:hypothetical protein
MRSSRRRRPFGRRRIGRGSRRHAPGPGTSAGERDRGGRAVCRLTQPSWDGLRAGSTGEEPMHVGRAQAFALRYPEPNNDGQVRSLTLARVETDGGLVGWGGGRHRRAGHLAGGRVLGRAPSGPSTRRDRSTGRRRHLAPAPGGDLLGRERRARDLAGQAAGVPLSRLLGGRRRERPLSHLPLYRLRTRDAAHPAPPTAPLARSRVAPLPGRDAPNWCGHPKVTVYLPDGTGGWCELPVLAPGGDVNMERYSASGAQLGERPTALGPGAQRALC